MGTCFIVPVSILLALLTSASNATAAVLQRRAAAQARSSRSLRLSLIVELARREKLTVRAAHARTGIAAADFSRIRNADLSRFTLDRLMSILNRLGARVDVRVSLRPAESAVA